MIRNILIGSRIHELNVNATILAFLPYHTSSLFTALLSILPKRLPPTFKFLHSYMSTRSNPPLNAIAQSAVHNQAFFATLNDHVLSVCKNRYQSSALLSLWASTAAMTIDNRLSSAKSGRVSVQNERTEDLLMQLLPVLSEGLALTEVPEYVIGCYIIIVILVARIDLDDTTLDALLSAVVSSWTSATLEQGLGCAAVIAQRKSSYILPVSVAKLALTFPGLDHKLGALAQDQEVSNLTLGLMRAILHSTDIRLEVAESFYDGIHKHNVLSQIDCEYLRHEINSLELQQDGAPPKRILPEGSKTRLLLTLDEGGSMNLPPGSSSQPSHREDSGNTQSELIPEGDVEHMINNLPQSIDYESFLAPQCQLVYQKFEICFTKLCSSKAGIERFKGFKVWRRGQKELDWQLLCSFYLRTLFSPAETQARREAATQLLAQIKKAAAGTLDFSALTVLSLVGLADDSKRVRQKTADIILTLFNRAEATGSEPRNSWQLYGALSTDSPSCSWKTLRNFFQRHLSLELEECIADAQHVNRVFQRSTKGSADGASGSTEDGGKRMKSSQREELMQLVSSHIRLLPITSARAKLLEMVASTDKIAGRLRSSYLLIAFKEWVHAISQSGSQDSDAQSIALAKAYMQVVHPKDEDSIKLLLSLVLRENQGDISLVIQSAALQRLHELWPLLKLTIQSDIAIRLIQSSRPSRQTSLSLQLSNSAADLFRSLPLAAEVLNNVLSHLLPSLSPTTEQSTKRRRTNAGTTTVHLDQGSDTSVFDDLRQLSLVLESVDASQAVPDLKLFHNLFNVMQAIQDYQVRASAEVDFPQLLALTNLLRLGKTFKDIPTRIALDTSIVRVDLLVDSLRKSSNSQAKNASLGLLSLLSQYIPEAVLHNIISVFTLMSKTTMRQSDEYSIQTVDQTIQQVIPKLADALRRQNSNVVSSTEDILWAFAATFDHIPHVRRLRLYNLLASSLGPNDCLHAIIATLADRWPVGMGVNRFAATLVRQFSHETAFVAIRNFIDLIHAALDQKSSGSNSFLSLSNDNAERKANLLKWLQVLFSMVRDGIDAEQLRQKMVTAEVNQEIQQLFGQTLERLLRLSKTLASEPSADENCSRVLGHLLQMLSFRDFLSSIGPILDSTDESLSRSVLKSLEVQLRFAKHADNASKKSALAFLPRLADIVESKDHSLPLRLNAVVCIDRICEDFGKIDLQATFKSAQVILRCLQEQDTLMRALAMHCLASMVEVLQGQYIPLLQASLLATSGFLNEVIDSPAKELRLHNAAFALIISVIENIAYMIAPDALKIQLRHAQSSAAAQLGDQANENRQQFYRVAAEKIEVNVLFSAASATWSHATCKGFTALHELITLLQASLDLQPKPTVSKHARTLLNAFLTFFDLRRTISSDPSARNITDEQLLSLEREAIALLLSLILKVNDATFRPFFVQLVEWTADLPRADATGKEHRQITLFHFVHSMSERLKSLVTPYFAYVLESAAQALRIPEPPKPDTPGSRLLLAAFDAITSSFKHDQDDFYHAPTRFALLHPALLAQFPLHNPAPATSLIQTHAIPTVVAFAAAVVGVPDHLSALNSSLLELLKGHQPQILLSSMDPSTPTTSAPPPLGAKATSFPDKKRARNAKLAAVLAMRALTRELGEEWLGMLPQMLPVVSELLEDGDERVESETEGWVKEMEGVLGESLSNMLA